MSENLDGLEEIASMNPTSIKEDQPDEKEDFDADDREDKCGETSVSSTESEKPCLLLGASTTEVADDDEGFKTPTSSDHKIPEITQCPPAPKKTRPSTSKRKVSSTRVRRTLHFDLSAEVGSMFPPPIQDDDYDDDNDVVHYKIKKVRIDDHDSSE